MGQHRDRIVGHDTRTRRRALLLVCIGRSHRTVVVVRAAIALVRRTHRRIPVHAIATTAAAALGILYRPECKQRDAPGDARHPKELLSALAHHSPSS